MTGCSGAKTASHTTVVVPHADGPKPIPVAQEVLAQLEQVVAEHQDVLERREQREGASCHHPIEACKPCPAHLTPVLRLCTAPPCLVLALRLVTAPGLYLILDQAQACICMLLAKLPDMASVQQTVPGLARLLHHLRSTA